MSRRLPRIGSTDLVRALKRAGWQEYRQTGSHLHLTHPDRKGVVLTVAIHSGRMVPVGTLSAILTHGGRTAAAFVELSDVRGRLMRRYTILLEFDPEAALYSVVVPALPGCTSSGETVEECLVNAREAIRGHIAVLEAEGEPVPDEADGTVVIVASVAA